MRGSDDYALTAVPENGARRGVVGLFSVTLAIPSALVFLSVGGSLGQAFGTPALVTALVVAGVIIGAAGWVLTSFAARSGLDSDLMSIRAGFGRAGSAITSAIYSVNFVVLYALETEIVVGAVHSLSGSVPDALVLAGVGGLVVALTWFGIASLRWTMIATLPVFAVLILFAVAQTGGGTGQGSFWSYVPAGAHVNATSWLSALAALLAFIVNATVAADLGRFLQPGSRRRGAFLFGCVLQLAAFGGATLLGAWFSFRLSGNSQPGSYLVEMMGGWGLLCVLISQLRINAINAYSGSLSISNFAARGLRLRPGRMVWGIVLAVVGTILATANISAQLVEILSFEAVFVMAWVSVLVTYIVAFDLDRPGARAARPLEAEPQVNPVGVAALAVALAVSTPLAFGAGGNLGKALAPLTAMLVAPVCVLALRRFAPERGVSARIIRTSGVG
jgi:purine-cytosine permease-like protein